MNAYTVLLVMIGCEIEARPNDFWPNVGTTLFTRDDLHKEIWSKSDIALLTARQYFQKLIPPPALITVENEFVDKMLAYFRDTYTAVKNVSPDQEVDRIMTTALSDTVGGYLKLCVLPVTKLSFYGGIASYESAYKVFRFYTEIKKYLATDGHSWRSPDQKTLNDFILNIPKFVRHKKQIINMHDSTLNEDPCTSFNYFEKSPKGLVVPMPVVNWDDVSMFLPIYNESTFSLDSPKHCNTLQNYYTKAKTCMNSKNKTVAADFDQKFQHWLSSDILPHLKDDHLYVALGNVLSLLNETRDMCDVILNMYNSSSKHVLPDFRSIVCSKTTIVVIIILVFELIWCIVAIDRLCCKKTEYWSDDDDNSLRIVSYFQTCNNSGRASFRKRNTKERETQYREMALNKPWFMRKWSAHSNYTEMDRDHFPATVEAGCQKELFMKCECPSTCIGTKCRSQSSFLYQVQSNDIFTIVNEKINDFSSPSSVPVMITNKSYTKIPSNTSGVKGSNRQKCYACSKSMNFYDDSSSTITRTKNRSAVTIYQSEKSLEGSQIIYRSRQRKDLQTGKTESGYRRNEAVVELKPYCISDLYPNRNWRNASNVSIELVNKPSINEVTTRSSQEVPPITKKASTVSEMVITRIDKETETKVQKNDNLLNQSTSSVAVKRDKKVKQSQRKRYLEIKIERPKAEIKLGISAGQESPRKGQSKIPTRKSVKYVQNRKTKRPNEACAEIPAYADKNIESVIKCIEQSTDYTECQVRPEEDIKDYTPQNHVKNYNALKSTLLSTQDVTTTSNTSNTDIQSIMSQQEQCTKTKSVEQHKSLMTIERSESDASRKLLFIADVPLSCTNSKEDTIIENKNDASSIDQETGKMAETERLIHTIYEHSKEALLSALATHEEKVVKEQNVRESCEIVMELTDGSETETTERYNLNKCQTQTRKNLDLSVKGIKTNTNPEMLKLSKHQKDTEPVKKLNKQERRAGTVKTKTSKCNKDKPRTTLQPPKKSLAKWKTCVELESCKQTNELAPTTKKSTIVLKNDTYDGPTCKKRKEDSSNCQTNLSATRKSKIPQLMQINDTRVAKTLNTEVRLNLSF